jgi:hypothetical protein
MASKTPTIVDVEPHEVDVHPDYPFGGVELVVLDRTGTGFRTIIDQLPALDVAARIVAAVARLKGATP